MAFPGNLGGPVVPLASTKLGGNGLVSTDKAIRKVPLSHGPDVGGSRSQAPNGSPTEHLTSGGSGLLNPGFGAWLKQRRPPAPALQGFCSALKYSSTQGTQGLAQPKSQLASVSCFPMMPRRVPPFLPAAGTVTQLPLHVAEGRASCPACLPLELHPLSAEGWARGPPHPSLGATPVRLSPHNKVNCEDSPQPGCPWERS